MERKILHIDVNNAFLSWTAINMLNNGEEIDIRNIPSIIGGDESKRRGIVLAKSPPAKKFGIVTGEPIYMARKKCPEIKIYPSNYKLYKYYSNKLYELFLEYTEYVERFSVDECFLDMTEFLMGRDIFDIAKEISSRIKEELGFTVNVGISSNKLLAKMASDFEKPDKIHTLYKNEIEQKMWNLPASELFMLGRKTIPKINKLGMKTIGDIAKADKNVLIKVFGKHGKQMWEYANGIDNSKVIYEYQQPKCIGNSVTLPFDIVNIEKLNEILLLLSEKVSFRLRKHNLIGNSISVQIKTKDFEVFSHQKKIDISTDQTKTIYELSRSLLEKIHNGQKIRLIGVRVSNLSNKDECQMSIFDVAENKKQKKLDDVMDKIKDKYGYNSITRAGEINVRDIINIRED